MMRNQSKSRAEEARFTQNFLHKETLVKHIVDLAALRLGDVVLEIGPGKGIITKALANVVGRDGQVIAVELDRNLSENLIRLFSQIPQVKILNKDILEFDLADIPRNYAVFANIPFNITSALLDLLFNPETGPRQAHLILQTEALIGSNERGTGAETFKSLLIKPLFGIELVHQFSKSDFVPQPSVDTALFAFVRRSDPLVDPVRYDLYKDFLAFVSKDRVGEGVWLRVFSRAQLQKLASSSGLIPGRGLKSQSLLGITSSFQMFCTGVRAKLDVVRGSMILLRDEQLRREQINRAGGHRRNR